MTGRLHSSTVDFAIDDAITVLERTPATLRAMLSGLRDHWIRSNEGTETWSPFDVVGHLIHGEETDWIPRARIILSDSVDRRFQPFDRFAQFEQSRGKQLDALLDHFESLRSHNIATLRAWRLDDHQLAATGEHPELGSVTLRQLLSTWVTHDLGHIAQIARVMAKQYAAEVGPWRAYLPVLSR